MGRATRAKELFTAAEVAGFCQVDLKTIHNWAERGELTHFRTPGRHLRFRQRDVLDFLRRYGYPVPPTVSQARPRVTVVESNRPTAEWISESLFGDFDVELESDPLRALLQIGCRPPDAMVLGRLISLDAQHVVHEIKRFPNTKHVRIMILGSHPQQRAGLLTAGASGIIAANDQEGLRSQLFAVLGVERPSMAASF